MRDIRIEGERAWLDDAPLDVPEGADAYRWAIAAVARDSADPVEATVHRDGHSVPVRIHPDGHVVVLDGVRAILAPSAAPEVREERSGRSRWLVPMLVSALAGGALTLGGVAVADAARGSDGAAPPAEMSTAAASATSTPGVSDELTGQACAAPAPVTVTAGTAASTSGVTQSPGPPASGAAATSTVVRTEVVSGAPGATATVVRDQVVTVPRTVVVTTTAIRGVTYTAFRTQYATRTAWRTTTIKGYCTPPPRPPR